MKNLGQRASGVRACSASIAEVAADACRGVELGVYRRN